MLVKTSREERCLPVTTLRSARQTRPRGTHSATSKLNAANNRNVANNHSVDNSRNVANKHSVIRSRLREMHSVPHRNVKPRAVIRKNASNAVKKKIAVPRVSAEIT